MSTDDGDERERKRPRLCNGDAAPPPEEAPCCWVCHVEGPDDDGKPLRRDCSCRGGSGFAHLSCTVEYARRKSKKARDPSQFRDPWSSCSQCRQYYFGELALDVATEFVAFTEEKYPADEKRLLEALSLKVWVLETIRPEEAKQVGHMLISRIEELRASNSSLQRRIHELEGDTYNTIAHVFVNEGTAESAESAVLYFEKYMDIQKAMGATEAVSITESNIALAKSKYEGSDNTAIEEVVEKQRLVYQNKVAEHGERSHDAIDYGLDLFGSLRLANRTIEAERLLTKLIASSMRVHGPDHTITKAAENKLIRCKKRKVTVQSHEERGVFQALRYEEDGKK